MSKTVTNLEKEIKNIEYQIESLKSNLISKKNLLNEAKGRQIFTFPDGSKFRYNQITLWGLFYTDKGLGYSDDIERFSEYVFQHPEKDYYVRFLGQASIDKFGIPTRNTKKNIEHSDFKAKFKEYKEFNDSERGKSGPGSRFYNL